MFNLEKFLRQEDKKQANRKTIQLALTLSHCCTRVWCVLLCESVCEPRTLSLKQLSFRDDFGGEAPRSHSTSHGTPPIARHYPRLTAVPGPHTALRSVSNLRQAFTCTCYSCLSPQNAGIYLPTCKAPVGLAKEVADYKLHDRGSGPS